MTPAELLAFDAGLSRGEAAFDRHSALDYAGSVRWHPLWDTMCEVKEFSMLGVETLLMCRAYGMASRSAILEIGPYVGGSTSAFSMGVRDGGRDTVVVSVDVGGAYADHPHLPSTDITADWNRNLASRGLDGVSTLVTGWCDAPDTIKAVEAASKGRKFDVFFFDADGQVEKDFDLYKPFLTDDCLLILDDYYNVTGSQEKIDLVTAQVHDLMARGTIEQYALIPFSTWFGRRGA